MSLHYLRHKNLKTQIKLGRTCKRNEYHRINDSFAKEEKDCDKAAAESFNLEMFNISVVQIFALKLKFNFESSYFQVLNQDLKVLCLHYCLK